MGHMLEMVNGEAAMVYNGEVPWHGLGVKIGDDLSPEEVLKKAKLDWTVSKHQLFAEIAGARIETERYALVRDRDDKVLDVVGEGWNPVQNSEAFEFFCEFVNAGDMSMHTAGSLKDGKHVWALAKLKDSFFELFGGDRVESYLLFSNPHMFGKSVTVQFTPVRVVCNNTLTLSLETNSQRMVRVNHRAEFDADEVKDTLGLATDKLKKYKEMAAFLGTKKYKDEDIVTYFNRIFPMTASGEVREGELGSRAAKKAAAIVETQPGAEFAPGTFWQLYNATTFTTDHLLGRTANTRMSSAWFGVNRDRKVKALETAVEMANAA